MNSINIVNIIPTITGFIKKCMCMIVAIQLICLFINGKISYAMFITISTLFVKVSVL